MVHNSSAYSFTPVVNQKYDIQGVLTYYNGVWRIELRKSGDVEAANSIYQIDDSSKKMKIIPNPAKDYITVELKAKFPVPNGTLRIFSMDGKLQYSENIALQELETGHRIPLDSLTSGSWILSLKYSESVINKVFIIK